MRLSIVVPYLGDAVAFEDSLVSVLENRPAGTEVCVAHDGSYQDPFDLGDEVRFIEAKSADLPSLIAAAAEVATGRVIHILGNGCRATEGWTVSPVEALADEPCGFVAPIIRDPADDRIVAAGWQDSVKRIYAPVASGEHELGRRQLGAVRGVYLAASFWRRAELRSAIRAAMLTDWSACEFAWSRLLTDAGWRCGVAPDSVVLAGAEALGTVAGFRRGQLLRALSSEIDDASAVPAVTKAIGLTLLNPLNLVLWDQLSELLGQAISLVRVPAEVTRLRFDQVRSPGEVADTLKMPVWPVVTESSYRRVA